MSKKKISSIEILLRNHQKKDLLVLYKKLFNQPAPSKWTQADLIFNISARKTESDIIKKWGQQFGVFNTSISTWAILDDKDKPQKNISKIVINNLGNNKWQNLYKAKRPQNLEKTKLITSIIVGKKYFFLVGEKGRTRYVLNGLNYEQVVEPRFSIVVWDDHTGLIQVRGSGHHTRVLDFIIDELGMKSDYNFKSYYIDNNDDLKKFAGSLNGKVTKVKLNNSGNSDLSEAEFTAKPTKSVMLSKEYKDFKNDGFEDSAGGVSFTNTKTNEKLMLWVGFTSKTIWLRHGSLDESTLSKVITALIKYGKLN